MIPEKEQSVVLRGRRVRYSFILRLQEMNRNATKEEAGKELNGVKA